MWEKIHFCYCLFVLCLSILPWGQGGKVKMDYFAFICSISTLTIIINKVCHGGCSCQVSKTVLIWDSLTSLPQEGLLKHGMFF